MNRLALIAATGALALLLTACGEKDTVKPTETTTVTVQPSDDTSKPADTSVTTTTTDEDKAKSE